MWRIDFHANCRRAHAHISKAGQNLDFLQKDRKMFWRGATWVGPILHDRVELLKVTEGHSDVADVAEISWGNGDMPGNFVAPDKMCSWKYIIYTEGCSHYSLEKGSLVGVSHSGRFKFLMLCSSVIIGPNPQWLEFWTHLIVPGKNYVEVKRDWTDLLQKHAELEANPSHAAAIAKETRKTAELLDSRGISCYIRELIRQYSDVCRWTVEAPDLGGRTRRRPGEEWMGVEDFLVMKIRY